MLAYMWSNLAAAQGDVGAQQHKDFVERRMTREQIAEAQRLSYLVYRGDEPVVVVVCIPDLNPLLKSAGSRFGPSFPFRYVKHLRNRRRAVIIFWAVHPSMWGQGLNPAMLYRVTTALQDAGYTHLGMTWIADENKASLRQVEKLGGRPLHRLHLFRRPL